MAKKNYILDQSASWILKRNFLDSKWSWWLILWLLLWLLKRGRYMRANQRHLYVVPNQRQAIIRSQPMSIREFTGRICLIFNLQSSLQQCDWLNKYQISAYTMPDYDNKTKNKFNFIFFCKIINNNNFVKITINLWHYYYYYYHYAHRAVYFITSSMRLANQNDLYKWKSEFVLIRTLLFANKQDQQRSLSDRSFFGIRRKTVTCSMLTNKK